MVKFRIRTDPGFKKHRSHVFHFSHRANFILSIFLKLFHTNTFNYYIVTLYFVQFVVINSILTLRNLKNAHLDL